MTTLPVICGTNVQRENITRKEVSYRKINEIDLEEFSKDIKFNPDYYNNKTVDELVIVLERTLKEALNKHAPEVRENSYSQTKKHHGLTNKC